MTIREAIRKIVEEHFASVNARVAIVKSVDTNAATCTVETLDTGVELFDVRLQAHPANGILAIPAVDSFVIIDAINETDFVVVMFSALDSIRFFDGSFGGLTKTKELKAQLDKTNEVVQTLVDVLTGFTPGSGDGGAALKAYASAQLSGKSLGDFSNIENEKITHGEV